MAITYFDFETVGREGAEVFLGEPRADARLTDPAKIEADRVKKYLANFSKLSLDPYGCRIAVAAWHRTGRDAEPIHVWPCPTEDDEREMLRVLLSDMGNATICGYNCRAFDLPVLLARCRLLGVSYPYAWDNPKWLRYGTDVVDLYELLTFGQGRYDEHVISRGLTSMCRVFGIDIPDDDIGGAWVAQAIAEGQWQMVQDHCQRDVQRTMALAQRLRVADTRGAMAVAS